MPEGAGAPGVLLIPGADGLAFVEDERASRRAGFRVRALELPKAPPCVVHPDHFAAVSRCIESAALALREEAPEAPLGAIGRNAGGGQLAFAAAEGLALDAMVLCGAIPQVSRFVGHSQHAIARGIRATEHPSIEALAAIDVTATLPRTDVPCLIQFGRRDPTLDETAAAGAEALARSFDVRWLDDVHAMVAPASLAQRWAFLEDVLGQPQCGERPEPEEEEPS